MNSDSDNIRNLLSWLLKEIDPAFSIPSGNGSTSKAPSGEAGIFEVGSDAMSTKPANQSGSESFSSQPSTSARSTSFGISEDVSLPRFSAASREGSSGGVPFSKADSQTAQSFNFGEIHAVQERFQALLKQRLLAEYENNPPLFPWESEVSEYPAEVADFESEAAISPLWSAHVSDLSVPGLLPKSLLNALFERCQAIACSPAKQGVRLVQAVKELFPEQSDILEPIAKMVLVPAYRSDRSAQAAVIEELANVAGGYDLALPEQQIALSMLAAQEILGALTFSVSAQQPQSTKQWVTPRGTLELAVTCTLDYLTIAAVMPDGGQLRLRDSEVEKQAARSQPGPLDIVWTDAQPNRTYVLEVYFQGEEKPLSLSVYVAND